MITSRTIPREALLASYRRIRAATTALCEPLSPEDHVVQSMPDASPTKWHLAHTTWFFETFVLGPAQKGYSPIQPQFAVLFNSYYQGVGPQFPRPRRGMLSRPSLAEVHAYRRHVDAAMEGLFRDMAEARFAEFAPRVELGLHHEEQHQELIVTDLKHMLSQNPLDPAYRPRSSRGTRKSPGGGAAGERFGPLVEGGVVEIGTRGEGFFFDNEAPRHKVYADSFRLGRKLVTAGEYREFMDDGGYARPDLWLSEGYALARAEDWQAPLYWRRDDGVWTMMTLAGRRPVEPDEPVCHVSYYEADAFARWAGARLPREDEWEAVAATTSVEGNFLEDGVFHPAPASGSPAAVTSGRRAGAKSDNPSLATSGNPSFVPSENRSAANNVMQLFGDVWEWTASAYLPYPGFAPLPGALGEYNGKFMIGQMVLRGGSCATPAKHIRPTYRNFFPPSARWQFSGIRLAR